MSRAQVALQALPKEDCFDYSEGRIVDKPFAGYQRGELGQSFWMDGPNRVEVTSQEGGAEVELRSHIFPKDSTGLRHISAAFSCYLGFALMTVNDNLGARVAAWGMKQAVDGPGEQLIERIEKTADKRTAERVKVDTYRGTKLTPRPRPEGPDVERLPPGWHYPGTIGDDSSITVGPAARVNP